MLVTRQEHLVLCSAEEEVSSGTSDCDFPCLGEEVVDRDGVIWQAYEDLPGSSHNHLSHPMLEDLTHKTRAGAH